MRWPLMTKAQHEAELAELRELYQGFVDREFTRAMTEGKARVRAWAVDANYSVYHHGTPRAAAAAAFQQAERQFGPDPITLSDALYAPANVQEAIDAITGS